ncbi:peptide deformylase [Patescibacteria group bacterium]|nr:MAG: peptide deformylase [Patescibacteria group bacterium]
MHEYLKQRIQIFGTVLDKVPEIRYAGDPVLRQATPPSTLEEGREIGKRMESVLIKYRAVTGWGRGLAAPQIGESTSVFVTFVDDRFELFINPKIVEKSETSNLYRELCLSAGVVAADVERPDWIVMEWMDEQGVKRSEKFDGREARLYQHEEAHLRGRLNVDDAVSGGIEILTFDPLKEQRRAVS